MNYIIIGLLTLISFSSSAHDIEGTLMLKGSVKTKTLVNGEKISCKLKVEKVKNLLQEDTFGNPAYNVLVKIELDGKTIKFDKKVYFNNLFKVKNQTEVRDFEYASENVGSIKINRDGRILSLSVSLNSQTINCAF
jgi:hypothetical protein